MAFDCQVDEVLEVVWKGNACALHFSLIAEHKSLIRNFRVLENFVPCVVSDVFKWGLPGFAAIVRMVKPMIVRFFAVHILLLTFLFLVGHEPAPVHFIEFKALKTGSVEILKGLPAIIRSIALFSEEIDHPGVCRWYLQICELAFNLLPDSAVALIDGVAFGQNENDLFLINLFELCDSLVLSSINHRGAAPGHWSYRAVDGDPSSHVGQRD